MTLPDQIDPEQVDIAPGLDIRDRKLLEILVNADDPVLSTTEIVDHDDIDVKSRSVQMHLTKLEKGEKDDDGKRPVEASDKTGFVKRKESGSGSVWWVPDEILKSEKEAPPGREDIISGLDAMPTHQRRQFRDEFPEFGSETPRLLRWSVGAVILGPILFLMILPLNVLRSDMDIGLLPDPGFVILLAGFSTLAGLLGLAFYGNGAVESRLRENDRYGTLPPKILNKNKYALGFALLLGLIAVLIEGISVLETISEYMFRASLLLLVLSLFLAFVAWLADLIYSNRQYFEPVASS